VREAGVTRARIEDYGLLSDCQSAALVGLDGSVDWWCPPRFDGPAVFARLLDDGGGHWSIRPDAPFTASRAYVGPSLVLRTVFRSEDGAVAVTDALALGWGARGHDIGRRVPGVLVRLVEGLEGEVAMRVAFAPRFEYGRTIPRLQIADGTVIATGGPATLRLDTTVALSCEDGTAEAAFTVGPGQVVSFCLAYAPTYGDREPVRLDPRQAVRDTVAGWASWADLHQGYTGRYREQVQRSALVLQGLTYQPTGAVLAAATTSLPEELGGERNYDYRLAWLRDLTLTMRALWVAACPDEADRLFAWIAGAAGQVGDEPIQIMYGPEGERDLTEHTLEHLGGFAGSRPVRVGNDAWRQRQLDVLGEVLDAAYLLRDQLLPLDPGTQALLVALADQAAEGWHKPDAGMWEARDTHRHYLSSKVLCWVALDRAVKLAADLGDRADPKRWARARDEVHRAVLEQGWSEEAGSYTGAFGSDELDASVLILPLVGFLAASDPRMRATINAIEGELGHDGLVYRWRGDTAGFFLCSYWLVECLALAGETERATAWFEQIDRYANDLGLLAEEADPATGAQLGNFPQAFSHVGLINAAWRLTQTSSGPTGPDTD
jgi:GH15 family glucan-1,4-alpha-glucosidase